MGAMGSMMGSGWMPAMAVINSVIGLAVVALLVVGVVVGVRWLAGSRNALGIGPVLDRAIGIARERYARGEISREEFERLRQDLS